MYGGDSGYHSRSVLNRLYFRSAKILMQVKCLINVSARGSISVFQNIRYIHRKLRNTINTFGNVKIKIKTERSLGTPFYLLSTVGTYARL